MSKKPRKDEEPQLVRIANNIIRGALARDVSVVRLRPTWNRLQVFEKNGSKSFTKTKQSIPVRLARAIFTRLKVMGKIPSQEHCCVRIGTIDYHLGGGDQNVKLIQIIFLPSLPEGEEIILNFKPTPVA